MINPDKLFMENALTSFVNALDTMIVHVTRIHETNLFDETCVYGKDHKEIDVHEIAKLKTAYIRLDMKFTKSLFR